MTLAELIAELEQQHPALIVRWGFTGSGYCDRGDYSNLEFEPKENVSVAEMLAGAKAALNQTYTGYKGGEFKMHEYVEVHIGNWGECGEEIGPTLLRYAFAHGWPEHYRKIVGVTK